jgi:hypothetical protein
VTDESGAGQRTPDITALVSHIVSAPGWSQGNAMMVVIHGTGGRSAWQVEQDLSKAPRSASPIRWPWIAWVFWRISPSRLIVRRSGRIDRGMMCGMHPASARAN